MKDAFKSAGTSPPTGACESTNLSVPPVPGGAK
jgi:hypothetical protein